MFANKANSILNVVMPPRCFSCRALVEQTGALCANCWSNIDFIIDPMCERCGYPLEAGARKGSLCGNCIQQEPPYDKARSVFCYNDVSKSIILSYKYSDKIHSTKRFAEWLMQTGKDIIEETDIIVPVPLHWRRLFERRYNQSALIAEMISRKTNLQYEPELLIRKKYTEPQVNLTRRQRLKNISGAIQVRTKKKPLLKGNNILLIDDVATTGATINECSKILKKAGAENVFVLTLGRTVEGR